LLPGCSCGRISASNSNMRYVGSSVIKAIGMAALFCAVMLAQDQPAGRPPSGPLKVCSVKNPQPCATAPRPIARAQAEYSDKARKKKISGTVVLEGTVGTDGHTHDIRVLQPLGYGLDEQAVKALRQWTFEPGTKDGQPVPVSLDIEMDFRIR
jgi:TonB family protein